MTATHFIIWHAGPLLHLGTSVKVICPNDSTCDATLEELVRVAATYGISPLPDAVNFWTKSGSAGRRRRGHSITAHSTSDDTATKGTSHEAYYSTATLMTDEVDDEETRNAGSPIAAVNTIDTAVCVSNNTPTSQGSIFVAGVWLGLVQFGMVPPSILSCSTHCEGFAPIERTLRRMLVTLDAPEPCPAHCAEAFDNLDDLEGPASLKGQCAPCATLRRWMEPFFAQLWELDRMLRAST